MRNWLVGNLLMLAAVLLPGIALADGMLVPVRPEVPRFSVSYHKVKVNIDRQIATTEIDQAFHNESSQQIEGTYIFPLADGMTISKFSMYTGGEELSHRILDRDEARKIYNGIVASRKDPALLEWLGTRAIQARVFPIMPKEDKRIRISYQEALKAQGGVVKYVYPLKTEKVSSKPLKECSVEITLRSVQPLRNIYSPTHNIAVRREGEYRAVITWAEQNTLPDQDLILYYTVSEKDLGLELLTFRDADQGDGYFLLMAAPKAEIKEDDIQPKDAIFVLDTSGSMAGEKITQAKAALKFCVNSLNRRDRFSVIAFSDHLQPWQESLQTASVEHVKAAEEFVGKINANGGTDINGALQKALTILHSAEPAGEHARPSVIVFLTDGLPTIGVTDINQILKNVKAGNKDRTRIFDFGVGTDYNAHFLDKLAEEHNGFAENVLPREDIEVKVSDFYAKVSTPLLMNLKIDWGGVEVSDLYPRELPDLFKGSQILLTGRYTPAKDGGSTLVRLTGELAGRKQTFSYTVVFPAKARTDEFIPRLWATRKIGFLEDQARLHGTNKELLEEIVRLSKKFGILTEYTSFLVDMDVNPPSSTAVAGGPRANVLSKDDGTLADEARQRITGLRMAESGGSAVAQSLNRKGNMQAAQVANGNMIYDESGQRVQLAQMRNISQRSFVQNGTQWVDVNIRNTQRMVKVKAYSPAYFQLVNAHPRMAQYMSQSANVTVAVKDVAIETGTAGQEAEFTPADFKEIKAKMDAEFGALEAAAEAGVPLAMVPPARSLPAWTWAFAFPLAVLPVVLARRLRRQGKKERR